MKRCPPCPGIYHCVLRTVWYPASISSFLLLRVLLRLRLLNDCIRPSRIQHIPLLFNRTLLTVFIHFYLSVFPVFELSGYGNGPVAAEAFAHVDETLFAFCIAFLELLALGWEGVF